MLKRISQNTLLYAVAPQVPKVLNFVLLPIITLYLTSKDFGVYGIILGYTGGLAALRDLGLTICVVNVFTNHPARWLFVWQRLFGFLAMWSVFFSLLQAIVLIWIIPDSASSTKFVIVSLYTISSLVFDIPYLFGFRYFQLKEHSAYIAFVTAFTGLLSVAITYYCIVELRIGFMGWFYAIFAGNVMYGLFYGLPVMLKFRLFPSFNFNVKFILKYLRVGLPTIPHNYSSYLYNASDRILLERFHLPLGEIGKYNFAYSFGNYVEIMGSALGMALGPVHLRLFAKKNLEASLQVRNLTFFFQIIFLSGAFLGCLWLKEIFLILIRNPELQSCYPYAIIIIMGYCYSPMYFASVNLLFYFERTRELWKISFLGGVLNVILNVLFIPFIGVYASIGATFISLMYVGHAGYFLKSFKELNKVKYYPVVWMLLITVLTTIAYCMADASIISKAIVSAVVVPVAAVALIHRYKFLRS